MKRTWIKIRRGLLTPTHRRALGIRVWLFMYMIDRAEWDTGIIEGWKDKNEAEDFGAPWRTVQEQRQQLAESGYIKCTKRQYDQEIAINNWTDPRLYPPSLSTELPVLQEEENEVEAQSTGQSTGESTGKKAGQPHREPRTPTSNPQDTNQQPQTDEEFLLSEVVSVWHNIRGTITAFDTDFLAELIQDWATHLAGLPKGHPNRKLTPHEAVTEALKVTGKQADRPNLKYADSTLRNWMRDGYGSNSSKPKNKSPKPQEVY